MKVATMFSQGGTTVNGQPAAVCRSRQSRTRNATDRRCRRPPGARVRFDAIVHALTVAVLVFRHHKLVYANAAAEQLRDRLRAKYRLELTVLLGDHLKNLGDKHDTATTMSLLTGQRGEPFYLHVIPSTPAGVTSRSACASWARQWARSRRATGCPGARRRSSSW
jgi:hypothetical protein